jgi:hypothetical protein
VKHNNTPLKLGNNNIYIYKTKQYYYMHTYLMQTFRIKISQTSNSQVHPLFPWPSKYTIVKPSPVFRWICLCVPSIFMLVMQVCTILLQSYTLIAFIKEINKKNTRTTRNLYEHLLVAHIWICFRSTFKNLHFKSCGHKISF